LTDTHTLLKDKEFDTTESPPLPLSEEPSEGSPCDQNCGKCFEHNRQ